MPEYGGREADLVASAKQGDEGAFLDLLLMHGEQLRRTLRQDRLPLDRDLFDLEDLVQQTFAVAWCNIDSFEFRQPGSFTAWITVIGKNEMRQFRRNASAAKRGGDLNRIRTISSRDQSAVTTIMSKLATEGSSELSKLAKLDQEQRLGEALNQLSADEQQLVFYRYYDGLSSEQIGNHLGMAPSSIRAKLLRTRKKLARILGAEN